MSTSDIFYLFPLAVYRTVIDDYDKHNRILRSNIDNYIFKSDKDNLTGEFLGLSDLHMKDDLKNFYNIISNNAREYLKALGIKEHLFDIYITKSWLSIIEEPELHMRYHTHTVSDISFVYYLDIPEYSDVLSFNNMHRPNELFDSMFDDMRPAEHTFIQEYNTANFNSYFFYPEEGMLFMFPGRQEHGTQKYPDHSKKFNGRRIAVVGDIQLYLKETGRFESGRVPLKHMKKFDSDDTV